MPRIAARSKRGSWQTRRWFPALTRAAFIICTTGATRQGRAPLKFTLRRTYSSTYRNARGNSWCRGRNRSTRFRTSVAPVAPGEYLATRSLLTPRVRCRIEGWIAITCQQGAQLEERLEESPVKREKAGPADRGRAGLFLNGDNRGQTARYIVLPCLFTSRRVASFALRMADSKSEVLRTGLWFTS